jgi:hypothetical protein
VDDRRLVSDERRGVNSNPSVGNLWRATAVAGEIGTHPQPSREHREQKHTGDTVLPTLAESRYSCRCVSFPLLRLLGGVSLYFSMKKGSHGLPAPPPLGAWVSLPWCRGSEEPGRQERRIQATTEHPTTRYIQAGRR